LEINNAKLGLLETIYTLIIVNAFVGGMIGMERTIIPKFAEIEFGIASKQPFCLIVAFGITKAVSNYFAGKLANRYGRKICFIWMVLALLSHLF
jgi:MFS family permease